MLTRYSPIAPIHLLEDLYSRGLLGNYLLLLAHDVLANEYRYASLMDVIRDHNEASMIIMDNSVVELGTPMNIGSVIQAADVVGASCIVSPDVMGSFSQTQCEVERHKDQMIKSCYSIMKIPQGETLEELMLCVEWLRFTLPTDDNEPELWGIPRWVANKLGTRQVLIEYIGRTCEAHDIGIHLLGMSENFEDDMLCANLPHVMGIDSANPLVCGLNEVDMALNWHQHMERGDYWDTQFITTMMLRNMAYVRSIVEHP